MPISRKPCSQRDLSCFLAGHKGTWPFYLNFFWENCLLDVDFQQPLPSEKNIHGWCFTWNQFDNGINLNSTLSPLVSYIFKAIYIISQKTVYEWGCHCMDCCWVNSWHVCYTRKQDPRRGKAGKNRSSRARQSSFGTSSSVIPHGFCQAAPESASQPAHLLAALFSLFK